MRILFVTPSFPFPLNDGGRLGYYNPIKYLSRRNEVVLVSFNAPEDVASVAELERLCVAVKCFRRQQKGQFLALARGIVMNPPGSCAKYWDPGFGEFIADCIDRYRPDVVELHHLTMAAYLKYIRPSIPVILREHNVEYKVWERQLECAQSWLEWAYIHLVAPRVRTYEGDMAPRFARCIAVCNADAGHLRAISPRARIEAIPSGVDTEYFYPSKNIAVDPYSLTTTGSFEWLPKQHSLWMLLTEIFPRIKARVPQAKLYVVGKGVPSRIQDRARTISGVFITGPVDDVRPYIARSSLILHYLEGGGGIALKVLEAMAMRKAVLSNRLGCEGIDLVTGRDCFLADGVDNFVEAATELLNNDCLRQRLAEGGFQRIVDSYAWHRIVYQLEHLYSEVLNEVAQSSDKRPDSLREELSALSSPRVID